MLHLKCIIRLLANIYSQKDHEKSRRSTRPENGLFDTKSFDIISYLRLFVNDLGIRKIIFDFSSLLGVSKSFQIVISRCELAEYFVCKPENLQIGSTKLDSLMANWTRGKPLETTGGRTRNSLLTEISDDSHFKPASEFT